MRPTLNNSKWDFLDAEKHIDLQMQDSTLLPRAEVERQHLAYHKGTVLGFRMGPGDEYGDGWNYQKFKTE